MRDRQDGGPGPAAVADAWARLCEHPALTWVPPAWRPAGPVPADAAGAMSHAVVRAAERNLLVRVETAGGAGVVVRLGIGPLTDREVGDGVDPVHPLACHDRRLDVVAATFEDALCALAVRVEQVLGPSRPGLVARPCAPVLAPTVQTALAPEDAADRPSRAAARRL